MADELPKVEKGIPLPPAKASGNLRTFVAALEPGDSFVEMSARYSLLRQYAKENGFKLAARKVEGQEGHSRYWRVEKEAAK